MMFALCVIDYGADYLTSQLKECRKTHMIGLRIKEERERLSLTQQGLADAIGVAKRTFIDWEKIALLLLQCSYLHYQKSV